MSILFIENAVTDWHLPFQRNAVFDYLRCVYESLSLWTNSCKVVTRKFPGQQLTVFPVVFPIMKTPLAPDCATLTGSSAAVLELPGCGCICWLASELNL